MSLNFLFLILLVLSIHTVISHEGEDGQFILDHSKLYPITQLEAAGYGLLIFCILVVIIILSHKKMDELSKKMIYFLVIIVISVVTIYLVITTIHLNIISETKGPVHWHADFEIWVCDKEVKLAEPKGLSNKQGVDLTHAHNDNRIHVEGVLLDKKQASLGAFFYAVGGSLSNDGIVILTDKGLESFHEGDKCNDKPAKLYVFVNGNLIQNPSQYVISPYEKVPPGDRIKIVFTEKQIEEINPDTGQGILEHKDGEPMMENTQAECDLDGDGDCDKDDFQILETSIGKCIKEFKTSAEVLADLDADGCITSTDREIYLQFMKQYNKKQ